MDCICPPGSWSDPSFIEHIPPICNSFVEDEEYSGECNNCHHELGCHNKETKKMDTLGLALETYIKANDFYNKLEEERESINQKSEIAYQNRKAAIIDLRPHVEKEAQYISLHGRTFYITLSGETCYVQEIDIILLEG